MEAIVEEVVVILRRGVGVLVLEWIEERERERGKRWSGEGWPFYL